MAAARKTGDFWIAVIAAAAALPVMVVVGVGVFIATRTPLHVDANAVTSVPGPAPASRWARAVEQSREVVRENIVEQNVPGASVAVGVDGEIVWAEGFGWANLETRAPVTPATRFRIGHVSKALTSAGVGLLRDQNRLHLDDEIQTYVPAFPRKQWPVTLRQLMANVAGIRHYADTEWGDKPTRQCDRAADGLDAFALQPLLFEPGTEYRYSTYGWVLVSAAVEAAANEPFFAFMRGKVFEPLGMDATVPDAPAEPIPDRATSYYRHFKSERTTNVDYSCFAGGGAFLSTPSDLVRFAFGLSGGRLLRASTVSLLQAPQQLRSGEVTDYGLGWMLETVGLDGQRLRVVGHASRTIEGASTSFLTFPDHGMVVVVTSNISFANMKWIALQVARRFLARPDSSR